MTEESTPVEQSPAVTELPVPGSASAAAPKFRINGDRAKLFSALAKARGAFSELATSRTADVQGTTKTGAKYSYTFDYADLATLQEATIPGLTEHGLSICQPYWDEAEGYVLLTILAHESGASIETEVYIPAQENVQKLGSALTYHKRYQWGGLLGIAAKRDDDDGNAASGNKAAFTDKPQAPKQAPSQRKAPPAAPKQAPAAAPPSRPAPAATAPAQPPESPQRPTEPAPAPDEPNHETGEVPAHGPITDATLKLTTETIRGAGITKRGQAIAICLEHCNKQALGDFTEAEALSLIAPGRVQELIKKLGLPTGGP